MIQALCVSFALAVSAPSPLHQETGKPQKPAPIFDEQADGSAQIAAALARASKENRRVLVEWGANWCVWCRRLHALSKSDPAIAKELSYEYEVVLVDVGRFDKHGELRERYGVDFQQTGIPYLTVLDAQGAVVANQATGPLELEGKDALAHDPKKVLEFLERHRATPVEAEAVLAAGLADAVRQDRRVFLHFGAPWCGWCGKLEAWMAQEDVRTILATEFVDLKIDVDRTVDGKETLQRFRGDEQQGIPWFAILDGAGKVLARGDMASGGPIGFPYEEAEIETFAAMLAKGATRLTPEDLGALKRSLAAVRERDERAKAERKAKEVPPEETKDSDDAETTEEQDG